MQTMRRINYVLAVAAMSVSAAFLASCCKSETTPQPEESQTIQFTATLAPKAEGTKAITIGTDGENKEILNVAWAEGEQVAIYYQKTDNSYAAATATVGEPNPDGSAPITATLTDAKGGTAKFVYPATLANSTGDIDEAALLNQNGNLNRSQRHKHEVRRGHEHGHHCRPRVGGNGQRHGHDDQPRMHLQVPLRHS